MSHKSQMLRWIRDRRCKSFWESRFLDWPTGHLTLACARREAIVASLSIRVERLCERYDRDEQLPRERGLRVVRAAGVLRRRFRSEQMPSVRLQTVLEGNEYRLANSHDKERGLQDSLCICTRAYDTKQQAENLANRLNRSLAHEKFTKTESRGKIIIHINDMTLHKMR